MRASELSSKQLDNYLEGRLGVIFDGTGQNVERIMQTKRKLDFHGYETILVFIEVDLEDALSRNLDPTRNRVEDPKYIERIWNEMNNNKQELATAFRDKMITINNKIGSTNDWNKGWKIVKRWLDRPVNTPYAQDWKRGEMAHKLALGESYESSVKPIALNENEDDKVADAIRDNCSQYLNMIDPLKHVLFRGIKLRDTFPAFSVTGTRENRTAIDIPRDLHNQFIEIIKTKGLTANRDNSWFGTGEVDQADYYGEVYVAFPTDGFHYTWSPEISDLFGFISDYIYGDDKQETDFAMEEARQIARKSYRGDDGSLAKAIESGYEIMFTSPRVILVEDTFYSNSVRDLL